MGRQIINDVSAQVMTAENGMGDFTAENVKFNGVSVEIGMGTAQLIDEVNGDIVVDNGMGDIELELKGAEEDYNYDIDNGLGTIKINNKKYKKEFAAEHNADYEIRLSSGMGETNVKFK